MAAVIVIRGDNGAASARESTQAERLGRVMADSGAMPARDHGRAVAVRSRADTNRPRDDRSSSYLCWEEGGMYVEVSIDLLRRFGTLGKRAVLGYWRKLKKEVKSYVETK